MIKKFFNTLKFITLVLFACTVACKDSEKENEIETTIAEENSANFEEVIPDENSPAIWVYDHNQNIPVKNKKDLKNSLSPKEWIDFLNTQNEKVQLRFSKIQGDTLFVDIPESTMLTQQMGTTGADEYLSVATFTLTEAESINFVHFDFEEGDHAIPGTYSRKYYIDRNKKRFQ